MSARIGKRREGCDGGARSARAGHMQESPARARGAVVVTSTDAQACSASPISVSPTQGTPTQGTPSSSDEVHRAVEGPRFLAVSMIGWEMTMAARRVRMAWRRWLQARSEAPSGRARADDPTEPSGTVHSAHSSGTAWAWSAGLPPMVLCEPQGGDWRIVAGCPKALGRGIRPGMHRAEAESCAHPPDRSATDAEECADAAGRIGVPVASCIEDLRRLTADLEAWRTGVVSIDARLLVLRRDPSLAQRRLRRLGLAIERWVPGVSIDGPWAPGPVHARDSGEAASWHPADADPAFIADLRGCRMLFRAMYGSERVLMERMRRLLLGHGIGAWLATASTPGAAVAVARHGCSEGRPVRAVTTGSESEALDPLPLSALRIGSSALESLAAVDVRRIGQLARLARQGVAERLSGAMAERVACPETHSGRGGGRRRGRASSGRASSGRSSSGRLGGAHVGSGPEASLFDAVPAGLPSAGPVHSGVTSDAGRREVLERLDQALGRRAEDRALLRAAEPISARCDFDGPCSRLETLVTACSGLADELVGRLSARRLGVRHATLRFRHADLHADLSSDATLPVLRPGASGPSSAGSLREVAAPRTPSMPASPDGVSTIELRFSTPVFRRAHLWEVLAPRL